VHLLLADVSVRRGDLATAYRMLVDLHRRPLELIELLQLIELQTRYELACGYDHAAIAHLQRKVDAAGIMPAPACAAMHVMLAHAAGRCGQTHAAEWLTGRATLMGASTTDGASFVEYGQVEGIVNQ
jgi:hypothetical protein